MTSLNSLSSLAPHSWVSRLMSSLSAEKTHRMINISDASKSSVDAELFCATLEKENEMLASLFYDTIISTLFHKYPQLTWITGHSEVPMLRWRNK